MKWFTKSHWFILMSMKVIKRNNNTVSHNKKLFRGHKFPTFHSQPYTTSFLTSFPYDHYKLSMNTNSTKDKYLIPFISVWDLTFSFSFDAGHVVGGWYVRVVEDPQAERVALLFRQFGHVNRSRWDLRRGWREHPRRYCVIRQFVLVNICIRPAVLGGTRRLFCRG